MRESEQDVERSVQRLKDWLRWLLENHREQIPTQGALAQKLGISEGGMSQWLASGSTRAFQFRYVIAIRALLKPYFPLDYLLDHDPPGVGTEHRLMAAEPTAPPYRTKKKPHPK